MDGCCPELGWRDVQSILKDSEDVFDAEVVCTLFLWSPKSGRCSHGVVAVCTLNTADCSSYTCYLIVSTVCETRTCHLCLATYVAVKSCMVVL